MSYLTCLLCFFLSFVFAQNKIYVKNGGTNNGDMSSKRYTDMKSLNIPNFAVGLYYYSLDASSNTGNASANGCFGSAYATNGPLVSYLTYFNVSAGWVGALNPATADVSKAVSLIGSAYIALEEVIGDINNQTVVKTTMLRNLQWNISQVTSDQNLKYATFMGTDSSQPNFSISFTFVVANNSATLTTGTEVSPKSVECVINILNYNFTSNQSALALLCGVGSAAMGNVTDLQKVGDYHRLIAGSGVGGVYWDGSTKVITNANGDTADVTINATVVPGSMMDNAGYVSQCNQMKQAQPNINVTYTLIRVVFPPSNNLTYGPAVGVDAFPNGTVMGRPDDNGNTATSLTMIPFFALLTYLFSTLAMSRLM
jgi:hypothetical protein